METIHDYRVGKAFGPTVVFAGYLIFGIGAVLTLIGEYPALVIMLLGGFGAFTYNGVLINSDTRLIKSYSSIMGLKLGKWEDYKEYPFITVLRHKVSTSSFSVANTEMATSSEIYFEVHLLSQNHRKKKSLARYKKPDEALNEGKDIAKLLQRDFVTFAPKPISRGRRR